MVQYILIIHKGPKTLISRLMVTLDNDQNPPLPSHVARSLGFSTFASESTVVDQALMSAVYAFSARWLPPEHFRNSTSTTDEELQETKAAFLETIWARAQSDVSRVMTMPSYRSILALYLFGITPTSLKNRATQFSNLCLEVHLSHYIKLRSLSSISTQTRTRCLGGGSYNDLSLQSSDSLNRDALERAHLEDTAFWFGIVCDTSRCLLKFQSSILLPGLTGDTKVWNLVRKQIEGFDTIYRHMQTSRTVLSDKDVLAIIQYGSSCKTLCWAAISHVQDTFIHHMTGLTPAIAIEKAMTELDRFEDVFGPLLDHIARDYLLLGEKSRVGYFLLNLHYHMGVLIFVETVDTFQDLSKTISSRFNSIDYRLTSTRAIVNLVNLSLQVDVHRESTSSLLLRDPYPEHISNGLSRAAHSIVYLCRSKLLNTDAANAMASAILSGLDILSQVSYTAAESLTPLRELFSDAKLMANSSCITQSAGLVAPIAALSNSLVSSQTFEDEIIKELGQQASVDPSLVNKTIEQHELIALSADSMLEDLQWIDFNAMRQDWSFEVAELRLVFGYGKMLICCS
ncbi:hypothetical protein BP6252_13870 [Coleophoma cylindrospora]|uniref:Transcription factor domain-containing protein n=1 Tax=Coleophoma cylindrospora TaxID=1849047 RepID=A0A3D8Q6T8_9HELO|nr:hypothetical protein BP6252_13870 [Coleophoma cylindrospora]